MKLKLSQVYFGTTDWLKIDTVMLNSNVNGKMEKTASKLVIAISHNNNFGSICSSTYFCGYCLQSFRNIFKEVSKTCLKPCVHSGKKKKKYSKCCLNEKKYQ